MFLLQVFYVLFATVILGKETPVKVYGHCSYKGCTNPIGNFMNTLLVSVTMRGHLDFYKICGPMVIKLTYFFGCRLFLVRVQDSPYMNLVGEDRKYVIMLVPLCRAAEKTALILYTYVSSFLQLQYLVIMFSLSAFQKSGRYMTSPNFSVPLVSRFDFMDFSCNLKSI